MNRKKFILLIIFSLIFIGLTVFFNLINLITDWFWFKEIGFENIFTTILSAKIKLGLITSLITFVLVYLNLKIALRITRHKPILVKTREDSAPIKLDKHINKLAILFSLTIGFSTGLAGSVNWEIVLKYLNAVSFGILDPIFSRDISFYFFTLPFLKMVIGFLFWIVIVSLIGTILIYASKGELSLLSQKNRPIRYSSEGKIIKQEIKKGPKTHLLSMLFFFFLIIAFKTYFISIPDLLYSNTGPFTGASFTDINASLPVLKALSVILTVAALICLVSIFRKTYRMLIGIVATYFVVLVLGLWIYPIILQGFIVKPNELVKETPYIINNIAFTQKAFKLNEIEEKNLSGETALTMKDIENNQTTIKNVRLWDREPLLDTFGQLQEIRTYYDFNSISNDRYMIDGEYRQTLLSPRELNSANLPNKNFINERLSFTHGYGLTLSPVNEVTEEGLPVLFIKDLPPVSTIESLNITRPEIYFGKLTQDYVIVKTKSKEFDYPAGEENVFSNYEGQGGVPIDSFFKKLLMTIRFKEFKLLLSDDITSESRIMYYRNIKERVQKVLPFIKLDKDPYLVITDEGSLKWIYDGYTFSNLYPYSEGIGNSEQINYIRNSVKIVTDAYDGKMEFYVSEPEDPLIQTYSKIFKNTFLALNEMPDTLKVHLRYPEDIFAYQTSLYAIYHMEEPQIFYNKEDKWQIPQIAENLEDPVERHIIMKLPGEKKEEFILMIPFTPQGKNNLSAWMVARSDGNNYGKLAVYRFPKQKLVFGPNQIINRINQDPEISRQISLWDQRGSEVNLGQLLVIPIEESILYIRPLYIRAEGGKIPELKRVIVVSENQIAMEETLEKALNKIFENEIDKPEQEAETPSINKEELILQANRYYEQALQAQQQGDWALYGQKIKELGKILEKLK
jgi:uncharacterized protein